MSLKRDLILYGGSFDPPGIHHASIVQFLSELFLQVCVVPCSVNRHDKKGQIDAIHRLALCRKAFQGLPGVSIDPHDLKSGTFTPTIDLDARYTARGQSVIHVIGSDLLQNNAHNIRHWKNGERVWQELRFVVLVRPGFPIRQRALPRHCDIIVQTEEKSGSREIRRRIAAGEEWKPLVSKSVARYIQKHQLYR